MRSLASEETKARDEAIKILAAFGRRRDQHKGHVFGEKNGKTRLGGLPSRLGLPARG